MKTSCAISTDGINIYIILLSTPKLTVRIFLIVLGLFLFTPFFIIISFFNPNDLDGAIFGIFAFLGLYIFIPLRLILWNIFGQEHLNVNTKTFSYQNHYGFIKTNWNTFQHDKLGFRFIPDDAKDKNPIGKIHFYTFDPETDLRADLFESTNKISKIDFHRIEEEINKMYDSKNENQIGDILYSMN